MKAVYTLVFIMLAMFNSIELSLQSESPSGYPGTPYKHRRAHPSIDQYRSYTRWIIPGNTVVQVYAEHIKRLYSLELNKEYLVLRSRGPGHRECFAVNFLGAGYAIYDQNGRRAAIMGNGITRTLRQYEKDILDSTIAVFKLPAEGLPIVPNRAVYGPPSRIPISLRDTNYEIWIPPLGCTVQVIQNHPQQSQRFYTIRDYQKHIVLRNPAGEVFAIKVLDQLHLLYDQQDREAAFNMSTGIPRTLTDYEKEFFNGRADTIKQIGSAEEIRRNMRP